MSDVDGLREALARWLFERDYRERGLASPDDAPWEEWSDRNQDEWREEAGELLALPVVTAYAEGRARERAAAELRAAAAELHVARFNADDAPEARWPAGAPQVGPDTFYRGVTVAELALKFRATALDGATS